MREISPGLLTLAHMGSQAYRQKYELIFRRECQTSNEIWQADYTQLDLYLLDSKGKERKPWLTIVIDVFSSAIYGYFLSFDAPSLHTALCLRQSIWRKENPQWPVCGIQKLIIQIMEATLCLYILNRFEFTLKPV